MRRFSVKTVEVSGVDGNNVWQSIFFNDCYGLLEKACAAGETNQINYSWALYPCMVPCFLLARQFSLKKYDKWNLCLCIRKLISPQHILTNTAASVTSRSSRPMDHWYMPETLAILITLRVKKSLEWSGKSWKKKHGGGNLTRQWRMQMSVGVKRSRSGFFFSPFFKVYANSWWKSGKRSKMNKNEYRIFLS